MKVLLTTLNSKYIHFSLALRYLKAYCSDKPWNIKLREFTINDSIHSILGEIYKESPDVVAFSCYIWNITEVIILARRIKQVMKDTLIILGGPEVSYDDIALMGRYSFIDYIVRGEGEVSFRELISCILEGTGNIEAICGVTHRLIAREASDFDRSEDEYLLQVDGHSSPTRGIPISYQPKDECSLQSDTCKTAGNASENQDRIKGGGLLHLGGCSPLMKEASDFDQPKGECSLQSGICGVAGDTAPAAGTVPAAGDTAPAAGDAIPVAGTAPVVGDAIPVAGTAPAAGTIPSGICGAAAGTASGSIIQNRPRELLSDLSTIPFPYTLDENMRNKIVYYEASRGCPFRCSYCLSSTVKGVRFFPVQRVKADLDRLIEMGVKQVKFVDRSFNCDRNFSREIFSHLIEKGGDTNFHFEIYGDLLDDALLKLLADAPPGLFQFETGVQTTNPNVLKNIRRIPNQDRLFENVRRISEGKNIHQHLDLIAGLPGEGLVSFEKSFNDVYALEPDMLQLGFLKLLKGSDVRKEAEEHGYAFTAEPPYEVISNKWLSYGDIRRLKLIEKVFGYYYNSHGFDNTIRVIIAHWPGGPFAFFEKLSEYWEKEGLHLKRQSRGELYSILYKYCKERVSVPALLINELLKFDLLQRERTPALPAALTRIGIPSFKQRCLDFLNRPENISESLPGYEGLSPKQIFKLVHFEKFEGCIAGHVQGVRGLEGNIPRHVQGYRELEGKYDEGSVTVLFDYREKDMLRGKARAVGINV